MTTNINLNTSLTTINKLHELAESSAKSINIDTQILKLLLIDHSVMFQALRDCSTVKIKEPKLRESM